MGEEGRPVLWEGSRRTGGGGGGWGGGKASAPAPREHPLLAGEKASQTYLRNSLRLQNYGLWTQGAPGRETVWGGSGWDPGGGVD